MPGNNPSTQAGPQPDSENQTAQSGQQNGPKTPAAINPLNGLTSTAPNPNAKAIIEAMAPPNPVVTNTEPIEKKQQQPAEPSA